VDDGAALPRHGRRGEPRTRPDIHADGDALQLRRAGWPGLFIGGTLFILPAAFLVLVFAWLYVRYGTTTGGVWLLYGIKPVIIAVVVQAATHRPSSYRTGRRATRRRGRRKGGGQDEERPADEQAGQPARA